MAAARAAGCDRGIAQSIAFLYRPDGSGVRRSETDQPLTDAPGPLGLIVAALLDLERQIMATEGVVLRHGWLYGPGTWFARDGYFSEQILRRCASGCPRWRGLSALREPCGCRDGWRGSTPGHWPPGLATSMPRASNDKAKRELGRRPAVPTWRERLGGGE